MSEAKAFILVIAILIFTSTLTHYIQRYTVDNNETATRGVFFQKTIYLKEYRHLGNGNGWFGKYDRYSRSDRHEDVLTIYKD